MNKILIIGSGGREHALAWKFVQDNCDVYCLPGNGGTHEIATNINLDINDFNSIYEFVDRSKIDMVVVGPEDPLDKGIVDFFESKGIDIFGPSQYASQLECSKLFAREFMSENNIPQPKYYECEDFDRAYEIKQKIGLPLVLKADGLAAGKGVIMCYSENDFEQGIKTMFTDKKFGSASDKISIEECLVGEELSVFAVCDGNNFQTIGNAQDHKRIFDNDKGPNTGGMGAYSPAKICNDEILEKVKDRIIAPTINGMKSRGYPYKGFLYVGLMIVEGEPFVIEFNVRMGDPETQVVIPRIKTSMYEIFSNCIRETIDEVDIVYDSDIFVTIVLASEGYPDNYDKGQSIQITGYKGLLFHAGTKLDQEKLIVSGGRVLNIVGRGEKLSNAINQAYGFIDNISFNGKYYRTDIGKKGL